MGEEILANPIAFTSIQELLVALLYVFMTIATPIVVFFLIYAGFMYVTAQGNPEKIRVASQALMYGIIGGVIILGSAGIATIIKNTVEAF
ncbi:hypothetical protein KC906_00390 [Candidatus Kaiserbacteria bacterium]|nr:hypothetical protein [Candidatus Kaiserbacteria bacterium]MCB9812049.1 hypothetical protein [Candidatus Nomurabacteria bacterium]